MIPGLYSAATALDATELAHGVIAQNLANANVPGYRRQGVTLETFNQVLARAGAPRAGSDVRGTRIAGTYNSFEPGPIHLTGNPLDFAIDGDGFFAVQG